MQQYGVEGCLLGVLPHPEFDSTARPQVYEFYQSRCGGIAYPIPTRRWISRDVDPDRFGIDIALTDPLENVIINAVSFCISTLQRSRFGHSFSVVRPCLYGNYTTAMDIYHTVFTVYGSSNVIFNPHKEPSPFQTCLWFPEFRLSPLHQ